MTGNGKVKAGREGAQKSQPLMWRKNLSPAVEVRWRDVDDAILATCVDKVTTNGAALILGLTSDGGAYSVCVLSGQDKVREYPHSVQECEDLLRSIGEFFDI